MLVPFLCAALAALPADSAVLLVRVLDVSDAAIGGDAILVTDSASGRARHVLIDASDRGETVLARLAAFHVDTLAAVILSHPHADHYGGLAAVLRRLPVRAFVYGATPRAAAGYRMLLAVVDSLAIPVVVADTGVRRLTLVTGDDTVTLRRLAPRRRGIPHAARGGGQPRDSRGRGRHRGAPPHPRHRRRHGDPAAPRPAARVPRPRRPRRRRRRERLLGGRAGRAGGLRDAPARRRRAGRARVVDADRPRAPPGPGAQGGPPRLRQRHHRRSPRRRAARRGDHQRQRPPAPLRRRPPPARRPRDPRVLHGRRGHGDRAGAARRPVDRHDRTSGSVPCPNRTASSLTATRASSPWWRWTGRRFSTSPAGSCPWARAPTTCSPSRWTPTPTAPR